MSEKTKWTEGEWLALDHGVGELVVYAHNTEDAICTLDDSDTHYAWKDGYSTSEEAKANAYLIAAAPEMYDTLRDILRNYECGDAVDESIRSALAKARGEAS